MRVLHLCAIPQLTGAAEPMLDLLRAERALGAEVELRIDNKRSGNLKSLLEAAGEPVARDLVLSTKAGAIAGARDVLHLRKMLARFDVVHTHLSHDHALAAIALGKRARPIIVRTIHAERVLAPSFGRRWVLRRSRGITVASARHKRMLVEHHAVDAARVLVLPGSVDAVKFRPDPKARERIRGELALEATHFAIGCIARFQAGRRHEVMIDALERARREAPELRLVLIGHGETEEALRARAKEGVLFPGYKRDDLNDWLAALDACVWLVPGNDATSRAVLQAMAAALPVIGGAIDGDAIAEAIVPKETGLLVDPDDPAALAKAFLELVSDRVRAQKLGEAGRARAIERFDPVARGRRALAFYEELIGVHETRALHRGA